MAKEVRPQAKLRLLRNEFEKGIDFHAESFREIDAKAKYWLTLTLPGFLAILSYAFQKGSDLSLYLVTSFSSVAVCLVFSIFFFAKTLGSVRVESGILSPGEEGFESANYFLSTDESWAELEYDQVKEACRAFVENEQQNTRKSRHLRNGERLLFWGLPAASCLAVGATFLDATAGPSWLAPTAGASTAAATGIVIGAALTAALITFGHLHRPRK